MYPTKVFKCISKKGISEKLKEKHTKHVSHAWNDKFTFFFDNCFTYGCIICALFLFDIFLEWFEMMAYWFNLRDFM